MSGPPRWMHWWVTRRGPSGSWAGRPRCSATSWCVSWWMPTSRRWRMRVDTGSTRHGSQHPQEQRMSDFVPGPLDRSAPFYVAGHRGLVGSAIWRKLEAEGFTNLIGRTSSELDLRNRDAVFAFMREV